MGVAINGSQLSMRTGLRKPVRCDLQGDIDANALRLWGFTHGADTAALACCCVGNQNSPARQLDWRPGHFMHEGHGAAGSELVSCAQGGVAYPLIAVARKLHVLRFILKRGGPFWGEGIGHADTVRKTVVTFRTGDDTRSGVG